MSSFLPAAISGYSIKIEMSIVFSKPSQITYTMPSQEFNEYVSTEWNEKIRTMSLHGKDIKEFMSNLIFAVYDEFILDTSANKTQYKTLCTFLSSKLNFTQDLKEIIPRFFAKVLKIPEYSLEESKDLFRMFRELDRKCIMKHVNNMIRNFNKQLMKLKNTVKDTQQLEEKLKEYERMYKVTITQMGIDHSKEMRVMKDALESSKKENEAYKIQIGLYINTIKDKSELLQFKDESIQYKNETIKNNEALIERLSERS